MFKNRGAGFYIGWSLAIGLAYMSFVVQPARDAKAHNDTKTELQTFGHECTVVGFQLIRMGPKEGSYTYHDYVVVENAKGERKRLHLRDKPAVAGDTWLLTQDGADIVLDQLVRKTP